MRMAKVAAGGAAILSVGVAIYSFRYLLPAPPLIAGPVAGNAFANPWLPVHAGAAALALLIGPFQFLKTPRGGRRAGHKLSGRVYAVCCLVGGVSGLVLALGSTAGPVATAGFGCLAVSWFAVTALGWKAAVDRRFDDHRRWMMRSFALTFAAVTLRLYLPIGPLLGFRFDDAYRLISFACWVPNIILVEAWIRGRAASRGSPALI